MKKVALAAVVFCMAACGAAPNRGLQVRVSEGQASQRYAETLVKKGHYLALKKAFALYRDMNSRGALRPKAAADYVRAGLLLALRERRIGLDNPATLTEVNRVIDKNGSLSAFAAPALIISAIPLNTRGIMNDISTESWNEDFQDRLQAAEDSLRSRARADDLSAAVFAAWSCLNGGRSPRSHDPAEFLKAHPDSILLGYEAAVCEEDSAFFKAVLTEDPEFSEAHYHLGQAALRERRIFDAESHLLRAYQSIPESPQPRILLAGIYFATEEFQASIQFYDLVLEISPEYRDALLGKAIALAYLGRHGESMAVLGRILELGFWLVGESHYWLARNLYALRRGPEALSHIDEAKSRLPTNTHVFSLAGKIASEVGEFERAEKDFMESLVLDGANTEALFGLGTLHAQKARWPAAAEFYEMAVRAYDTEAEVLGAVIEDLKAAALPPERKSRLLLKRSARLEEARLESATAAYDAAAAYVNAGNPDKAREMADKAAVHPVFREKAGKLLSQIDRKLNTDLSRSLPAASTATASLENFMTGTTGMSCHRVFRVRCRKEG